jgi:hypothetical protein
MEERRLRWVGNMSGIRKKRNIYMVLVRKPEGK